MPKQGSVPGLATVLPARATRCGQIALMPIACTSGPKTATEVRAFAPHGGEGDLGFENGGCSGVGGSSSELRQGAQGA